MNDKTKETLQRNRLAQTLSIDRQFSIQEVRAGFYATADKNLKGYKINAPGLEKILENLNARKEKISGLDVGCGTGRAAAEIMETYPNIDMQGVTLTFHPPVGDHKFLPRHRVKIARAGNAGFTLGSFDFLIAVGSLDVTRTIFEEGKELFKLVGPDGYFIFSPIVWNPYQQEASKQLKEFGEANGFSCKLSVNMARKPSFSFHRAST